MMKIPDSTPSNKHGWGRREPLTSILEVLLAELLGDVVVALAESAVAVVAVAPPACGRPPREPPRRSRGGRRQEGAPGGGGRGGAAQRERHGRPGEVCADGRLGCASLRLPPLLLLALRGLESESESDG